MLVEIEGNVVLLDARRGVRAADEDARTDSALLETCDASLVAGVDACALRRADLAEVDWSIERIMLAEGDLDESRTDGGNLKEGAGWVTAGSWDLVTVAEQLTQLWRHRRVEASIDPIATDFAVAVTCTQLTLEMDSSKTSKREELR